MIKVSGIDQQIQDILSDKVSKIKADYAEIRAEESELTRVIYNGKDPELIAEPHNYGFFVRVLVNGSWGIATFTDIDKLDQKINEAITFAKIAGKGKVNLSDQPEIVATIEQKISKDFRQIQLKDKVKLAEQYNQLLLKGQKGIESTHFAYHDTYLTKYFVNSKGSRILQYRPYVRITYQAIAKTNDVIEIYRGSDGHIGGYEVVEGLDDKMLKVAKEAVELSKLSKVKGGNYTVILDPFMAGTFVHEAFGHFAEADHQYENPQLLSQMEIGKKIGSDIVTIIDDPSLPTGWGNYTYDDEGVLAKPVNLITEGIITGRLHTLETAGKLNEIANGRARADGFNSKPIVRMSNTYFKPGKETFDDLLSSTKNGLLVVNWIAGMTALENFTFTALYGVMIENGKLNKKVRGVKLMGNIFETLKNIDAASSDFSIDQGTCGKMGQHMPVGSGGSYIRINNITIGGG